LIVFQELIAARSGYDHVADRIGRHYIGFSSSSLAQNRSPLSF
jgi:hypothetical protein